MELVMTSLTKEFQGFRAVNQIDYTMHNEVYGLLGVNGAGKTTLMRMLCTLLKPTEGNVTWNGEDIFQMGQEYRNLLGYLPQDYGFYPDFTVYDYLMYIASIKGVRAAVAKARVEHLLKQVGMEQARSQKMKKLSGGMKRRVGIAQAMMNDPKILILDEPTSGLDPNERIRFRNLISELSEERLVLLSTHIVSDIEYIANDIILMKDGSIVNTGTPERIIAAMPERVWSLTLPKAEVTHYTEQYKVVNIKTEAEGAVLRVISEQKPNPDAVLEHATLEDVFLYYFGEKAGVLHGEV